MANTNKEKVAVLIPCFNEELTIGKVIKDFKSILKDAEIYVFDNNSTDKSKHIAKKSGAIIFDEFSQGKGNVIRSMFRLIEADIYIMIDADNTYPADEVKTLMQPIIDKKADMVVGDRLSSGKYASENTRLFHNFGNNLVRLLINTLFKSSLKDIMSGYRVFSRNFVKNIPISSQGFEVETEMTLHALDKKFRITEIPINYRDRPLGSYSKLNTVSDGLKVLKTIFVVFKDFRPLLFFSIISLIFFFSSFFIGLPVINEFIETGLILKIPSAILATGLMLVSVLSLFSGFILDSIAKQRRDTSEILLKRQC